MQTALLIVMFLFLNAVPFPSMDLFFTNLPTLHTKHYPRNSALSLLADEMLLLGSNCSALNSYPPANLMLLQREWFFLK